MSPTTRRRPIERWLSLRSVILAAGVLWTPAGLWAQDAAEVIDPDEGVRIFGVIVDRTTGEPVPDAEIELVPAGSNGEALWSGSSGPTGEFSTDVLPLDGYELSVDSPSFAALNHLLVLSEEGVVDLRVEIVQVDFQLEPIVAVARRETRLESVGFHEREAIGRGHFFSREDIEERAPTRLADLFRTVPGVRVIPGGSGRGDVVLLRQSCRPLVVLDGVVLSNPVRLDEMLPVSGVEGIEVYQGSQAPIQYTGSTTCGVIMVWSRAAAPGEGKALSWGRVLTAVGIGGLIIFAGG